MKRINLSRFFRRSGKPSATPIPDLPKPITDPPEDCIEENVPNNLAGRDLRLATEKWMAKYPWFYERFCEIALGNVRLRRMFSAKQIVEQMRWDPTIKKCADEEFKICNSYTAYIARKFVEDYPEALPFLRFRRTRY